MAKTEKPMNIEPRQLKDKLDYGELTEALQKVCQDNSSLSGMSHQILREI